MKNKKGILVVVAISLLMIIIWTAWGNTALEMNSYVISSDKLPDTFGGYRIAHVSDLHNTEIGSNNEKLLAMLRDAKPDMIAITGDFIDSRRTNVETALRFAEEALKVAPCYYVTGNHEARVSEYNELKSGLMELGVYVLENEGMVLQQGEASVALYGVNDPSFHADYLFGNEGAMIDTKLKAMNDEDDMYKILLSHRPELFHVYVENDIDLILSGHAHGGQFRLPFVGGLIAPNQGLLPKYDAGLYTEQNTNMIVSRGIGNSAFPFRFNNRPEVIVIELEVEK